VVSGQEGHRRRNVDIHLQVGDERSPQEESAKPRERPTPTFMALIVADLRGVGLGASSEGLPPLSQRKATPVDRDDLDQVLAGFGSEVEVPVGNAGFPMSLRFQEMEDFHPDRLIARAPLLRTIRELRSRVEEGRDPVSGAQASPAQETDSQVMDGEGLLDEILTEAGGPRRSNGSEGTPGDLAATEGNGPGDMQAFLRRVTQPHEVTPKGEGRERRLAILDEAMAARLRSLLRHPRFQAMEALWRGISFLVHRLETGPRLKICLLHATPEELSSAAGEGGLSPMLAAAAEDLPGAPEWNAIMVHQSISREPSDMLLLEALARTGQEMQVPILAEVDPTLLESDEGPESGDAGDERNHWSRVREHPGAAFLGLLLPRFLLRAPYGEEENPMELLDFEELEPEKDPELAHLLWGHPGFLAVLLLGTAFQEGAASEVLPGRGEVTGLPPVVHRGGNGAVILPPVEVALGGGEVTQLARAGFIPVEGRPGESTLRIRDLPSVATSGQRLQGI
jgi:type VI secretion system ImpB/VipA family protein